MAERNRNQGGVRDADDVIQPIKPRSPDLPLEVKDLQAHILIVDDEKVNRDGAGGLFKR